MSVVEHLALFLQGVTASVDEISNPAIKDTWQKGYESLLFGVPMQLLQLLYCCNLHLVT